MTNLLEDGVTWLQSQLKTSAATAISYARGSASVTLNTTVGSTPFEAVLQNGMTVVAQSRDYLFAAEDLILDGSTVLPEIGDQIVEGDDTYEIMTLADAGQHFAYLDPYKKILRVHTKQVR